MLFVSHEVREVHDHYRLLVLVTLNNLNTRCCIEWGDTIKNCVISYSMWDQINDMNRIHPSTNSVVLVYWWFD